MPPAAPKFRVVLALWDAAEARERQRLVSDAGYRVESIAEMTPAVLKALKDRPPDAIVIDLSRLPSHGRRLGEVAREQRSLRHVPLVFVDGERDKVDRVKQVVPDAVYTTWHGIARALARAIANPPAAPVVPAHQERAAGYSGTPLPKKLGIKPGAVVCLVGAPDGFMATLGLLPAGVTVREDLRQRPDVAVFFVRRHRALERVLPRLVSVLEGRGAAWVAWPKKASGVESDLSETGIRALALANGLVDFKVCAIDATWSGLRLARRRAGSTPG